ncbi:MAG: hypothetical protein IJ752_04620 [Alphaproteobacteria bacterium]|nr:hypothetical protein [Alphaproteobacteria bacterium]
MAENKKASIVSPTLITAVVCVLASVVGALGVDVTATEQAEIVGYTTSAITGVSGLVIIGRNLYSKYKAKHT